jgi:hypothetical protein
VWSECHADDEDDNCDGADRMMMIVMLTIKMVMRWDGDEDDSFEYKI